MQTADADTVSNADRPCVPRELTEQTGDVHYAPATFMQEVYWLFDAADVPVANCVLGLRILGSLDVNLLRDAVNLVVDRHEALRTVILDVNGNPVQRIASRQPVALEVVDVEAPQPDALVDAEIVEAAKRRIRLSAGPLMSVRLLRFSVNYSVLLTVFHHAVVDGWSFNIYVRELTEAYEALERGAAWTLRPLKVQLGDYAFWEREAYRGDVRRTAIAGLQERLAMPPDRRTLRSLLKDDVTAATPSIGSQVHEFVLEAPWPRAVLDVARERKLTVSTLYLTAAVVAIHTLADGGNVPLLIPYANRPFQDLEAVIGLFARAIPIVCDCPSEGTLLAYAEEISARLIRGMRDVTSWRDTFEVSMDIAGSRPHDQLESTIEPNVGFQYVRSVERGGTHLSDLLDADPATVLPAYVPNTGQCEPAEVAEQAEMLPSTGSVVILPYGSSNGALASKPIGMNPVEVRCSDHGSRVSVLVEYQAAYISDDAVRRIAEGMQSLLTRVGDWHRMPINTVVGSNARAHDEAAASLTRQGVLYARESAGPRTPSPAAQAHLQQLARGAGLSWDVAALVNESARLWRRDVLNLSKAVLLMHASRTWDGPALPWSRISRVRTVAELAALCEPELSQDGRS